VIAVCTNKAPVGAFRAVGWTAAQTAPGAVLRRDRARTRAGPGGVPAPQPDQRVPAHHRDRDGLRQRQLPESLERALQLVGYDELRRRQAELRQQGRYLGIGISLYVEPTAWGSEIALQAGFPFPSHDNATVTIDPTGKVRVAVSVHSHGQGHETDAGPGGSRDPGCLDRRRDRRAWRHRACALGHGHLCESKRGHRCGMVALAAQEVRERCCASPVASSRWRRKILEIQDGTVFVRGAPDRSLSMFQVAFAAYLDGRVRAEGEEPPAFGDQVLRSTGHVFERMHRYRLRGGRRDGSRPARQDRGG
jgi:carbon-monoxide dehydrogenase large subunit